jgi:DivIVA domain-containing protein
MVAFVAFVVGVLVVGGLLFLGVSLLLGRGETRPPAELDRSPVQLPDDRPVTAEDVRALRISVTARGYRMTEVDWLLDQFALTLEERDAEIARLRTGGASTGGTCTGGTCTGGRAAEEGGGRSPDRAHSGGAPTCVSWSNGSMSMPRPSRCGRR